MSEARADEQATRFEAMMREQIADKRALADKLDKGGLSGQRHAADLRAEARRLEARLARVNAMSARDEARRNGYGLTGKRVRLPDGRTGRVSVVDDRAGRESATVLGRLDDGTDAFSARAIDVEELPC